MGIDMLLMLSIGSEDKPPCQGPLGRIYILDSLWCVFESALGSIAFANDILLQEFLCACDCFEFY